MAKRPDEMLWRGAQVVMLACVLPFAAWAADVQVNVVENAVVNDPALARQASGETFFVWDRGGIVARRFDAAGLPLDAIELEISDPMATSDGKPDIAMNDSGDAVVVWQGRDDGADLDIWARLYPFAGAPSPEFKVNLFDTSDQFLPKVVMDSGGAFAVVYKSLGFDGDDTGIVMRRFDASGQPLDNEQLVNVSTIGSQVEPALAQGTSGQLVVSWIDDANGANRELLLRLFDASGSPTSGAISVATNTFFNAIAISPQGNVLVVWSGARVTGRVFDSLGMPLTGTFFIDVPDVSVGEPAVAAFVSGDFQVVWEQSPAGSNDTDIYGRVVQDDGTFNDAPSLMPVTRQGIQDQPDVVADDHESVVVFGSPDSLGVGIASTCLTAEGCLEVFKDGFESGSVSAWDAVEL